jgi:hypothetical protein
MPPSVFPLTKHLASTDHQVVILRFLTGVHVPKAARLVFLYVFVSLKKLGDPLHYPGSFPEACQLLFTESSLSTPVGNGYPSEVGFRWLDRASLQEVFCTVAQQGACARRKPGRTCPCHRQF